jgi:hypothetical protein
MEIALVLMIFKNNKSKRSDLGIKIFFKKNHKFPRAIVLTNPITTNFFNWFSQLGYQNCTLVKIIKTKFVNWKTEFFFLNYANVYIFTISFLSKKFQIVLIIFLILHLLQ